MNQIERIVIAGTRVASGDPVVLLPDVKNSNGTSHAIPYSAAIHSPDDIGGLALDGGSAGSPINVLMEGWVEVHSANPARVGHKVAGSKIVVSACDRVPGPSERYRLNLMIGGPEIEAEAATEADED